MNKECYSIFVFRNHKLIKEFIAGSVLAVEKKAKSFLDKNKDVTAILEETTEDYATEEPKKDNEE